jgi:hypothetical protein
MLLQGPPSQLAPPLLPELEPEVEPEDDPVPELDPELDAEPELEPESDPEPASDPAPCPEPPFDPQPWSTTQATRMDGPRSRSDPPRGSRARVVRRSMVGSPHSRRIASNVVLIVPSRAAGRHGERAGASGPAGRQRDALRTGLAGH